LSQRRRKSGNGRQGLGRGGYVEDVVFDGREGLHPEIHIRGKAVRDMLQTIAGLNLEVADRLMKLGNLGCQVRDGGARRGGGPKERGTVMCDGVDAQPGEDGAIRQYGGGGVEDHYELGSEVGLVEGLPRAVLSRELFVEGGDDELDSIIVVNRTHRRIHESGQFLRDGGGRWKRSVLDSDALTCPDTTASTEADGPNHSSALTCPDTTPST
jgi:hypothetical protein